MFQKGGDAAADTAVGPNPICAHFSLCFLISGMGCLFRIPGIVLLSEVPSQDRPFVVLEMTWGQMQARQALFR